MTLTHDSPLDERSTIAHGRGRPSSGSDGRWGSVDEGDRWVPGTSVGDYRIERFLGRGGMGEVYAATQLRPVTRLVALKRLRRARVEKRRRDWFEVERQVLAQMQHPGIAQFFDAGTAADGSPYFVMELIDGTPVTTFCEEEGLSLSQRLELFVQLLEAVQHAHQRGVIHRDLKPRNVLVTRLGSRLQPKIIDFGIASAVDQEHVRVAGTPAYMSPEQAHPETGGLDTRSDVYALGVLLQELLTHSRPESKEGTAPPTGAQPRLPASEAVESLGPGEARALARSLGLSPRDLRRVLREELDWVIRRAVARDRDDRYPTASAFGDDLRNVLDGRPVRARPASLGYVVRSFVRRHRLPVVAAATVLVGLLAGLGTALLGLREARAQRAVAMERSAELEEVVAFQQKMLKDVDLGRMGFGILQIQRRQIEGHPALEDLDADRREEALRALDRFDVIDLARGVIGDQILERASEAIDRDFARRPLLAGRLRATLADLAREIGQPTRALPWLERVAEVRRAELGSAARETLRAELLVAGTLLELGRNDEGSGLLEDLEARSAPRFPPEDSLRLEIAEKRAESLLGAGEFVAAASLLDGASDRAAGLLRFRLRTLGALARMQQGKFEEALRLLNAAIGETQVEERLGDPGWYEALSNSVGIRAQAGDPEGALRLADGLVAHSRESYGHEHPSTLAQSHNRAAVLIGLGRYEESVDELRRIALARERVLGPRHPRTLRTLATLTAALARWKNAEPGAEDEDPRLLEAIDAQRRVVRAREDLLGPDHSDTLRSRVSLGSMLQSAGRLEDAERHVRRGLESYVSRYGVDHHHALQIRDVLAGILAEAGRTEDAIHEYLVCLEHLESTRGVDHAETLDVVKDLVEIVRPEDPRWPAWRRRWVAPVLAADPEELDADAREHRERIERSIDERGLAAPSAREPEDGS